MKVGVSILLREKDKRGHSKLMSMSILSSFKRKNVLGMLETALS
jgi:hypothetical protein